MDSILHFNLSDFIRTVGYFGIFAIVFAESGLLFGFFFPGDSLLFTAGFLASQHFLDFKILLLLCMIAAIVGDSVGYAFGRKVGPALFNKKGSLFFDKDHINATQDFYKKHGGKTIIMARFIPIVRTFAPILAGVGRMRYRTFLAFNIIGGVVWVVLLSSLGFYLGKAIPNIDHYLLPIVILIIVISLLPTIIHVIRDKNQRTKIIGLVRSRLKR